MTLGAIALLSALALHGAPATTASQTCSGTQRRSSAQTATTTWSVPRAGTSSPPGEGTIAFARGEATTWCVAARVEIGSTAAGGATFWMAVPATT